MKTVIDVPEQLIKRAEHALNATSKGQQLSEILDKISAEIKSMEYHMIDCDVLVSQEEVLDIIEKYKREENE